MTALEWLSPSACNTFLQCPLKLKYERIDRLPQPPNINFTKGNFVHEILENLMKLDPEERTLPKAKEFARKFWDQQYGAEAQSLAIGADEIKRLQWDAWWCVDNYFNLEEPAEVKPFEMERWVSGLVGGAKIRGKIDRIDEAKDGLELVDYKTGKTPKKAEWGQDAIFQLNVYGILLASEVGIDDEVSKLVLLYLGDGNKREYDFTEEGQESAAKTVASVRKGIDEREASGEWEPRPSKLCDWCAFKDRCPAWT